MARRVCRQPLNDLVFVSGLLVTALARVCVTLAGAPSSRVAYYLHTAARTWNEASAMCRSYQAVLLSPPMGDLAAANGSLRYADRTALRGQLQALTTSFWVGLHVNSSGCLRWQGCQDFNASGIVPNVLLPSGSTTSPFCFSSDVSLRLSPLDCSARRPYICQRQDGQCWFQPYADTEIRDPDAISSHENSTSTASVGDCAKLCRGALERERECWAFTFREPTGCKLSFSDYSHRYALHTDPNYAVPVRDSAAYVKICTGGWTTTLSPPVTDTSSIPDEENCTGISVTDWDDYVCYCECDQSPVILDAETLVLTIDEKVDKIVKELQVNPDNTSSTRRKKESAEDSRPSAQGIGYVGVAFLGCVFGGIFLMDASVLYQHAVSLYKRLKLQNV